MPCGVRLEFGILAPTPTPLQVPRATSAATMWVANSQQCLTGHRNALAVRSFADPNPWLRFPRWFTRGRRTRWQ